MITVTPATPTTTLSPAESGCLLAVARQALAAAVRGQIWSPNLDTAPARLLEPGACFVTLFTHGRLHGCIGSVEPRLPLILDVAKNAEGAARRDPRFPTLLPEELESTGIEISVLSPLRTCLFHSVDDLIGQLRPGVDGVLVERGWQRGLLLPQVWEKLPDPRAFLDHVALKACACMDIYEDPDTRVSLFEVDHYREEE